MVYFQGFIFANFPTEDARTIVETGTLPMNPELRGGHARELLELEGKGERVAVAQQVGHFLDRMIGQQGAGGVDPLTDAVFPGRDIHDPAEGPPEGGVGNMMAPG